MPARKGEKYRCEKCGLIVTVNEDCKCEDCDILCCKKPMKKMP